MQITVKTALFAAMLATAALAQTTALGFRPVDARYSKALDRIVAVSSNPNALHIYDPETAADVVVPLSLAPLSVSVGPSGLYAAVGHDAKISYVNLVTGRVEREFTVAGTAKIVVLSADYIYVMPSASVDLRTGTQTGSIDSYAYGGTGAALHPSGTRIYGTQDGLSPNDVFRFEFSGGTITARRDSPYHGDYPVCGQIFYSEDGKRIFTGCSGVFGSDDNADKDMRYRGTLEASVGVQWAALSSAAGRIASIPVYSSYSSDPSQNDSEVRFHDYTTLSYKGRAALPDFNVSGRTFKAHGKWLFYNAAGSVLYTIMQADSSSGLLNDFAVHRIATAAPAGCTWSLSQSSAAAAEHGGPASVGITAPAHCHFQVTTASPWITPVTSYGAGSATIAYSVAANPSAAARTGTIVAGGQTLTVTQAGAVTPLSNPLYRLGFKVSGAVYSKPTGTLLTISSSAPHELHIFDPVSRTDKVVALPSAPTSVSAHPAAAYAMVGHDGWLSYINLLTGAIEKRFEVSMVVNSAVVSGNSVYIFSRNTWGEQAALNMTSGTASYGSWIYNGIVGSLHASGKYIYTEAGKKLDVSAGQLKLTDTYNWTFSSCGYLWLTEDGQRMITRCGSVHRSSEVPAEDLAYNGKLSPESYVQWADYSSKQRLIAAIPTDSMYDVASATTDVQLRMFNYDYLTLNGQLTFPTFPGGTRTARGRYVFWNHDASALYVILQADYRENLAADFAVWTVSPDAPQTGCTVALSPTTASVANIGGTGEVAVTSGTSCTWKAVSSADWLTVDSGSFGFGSGTVRYTVKPNTTTAARTATVTAGGATFTVAQAAGSPTLCTYSLGSPTLVTPATGLAVQVTLTAVGSSCAWTAVSNASWAQVFPLSGTGSQTLSITVFPNFTTKSRTAQIAAGGKAIDIAQAATAASLDERYVRFLYFNHFGRHPSTTEVQGHLMSGLSRAQLAVNFLSSLEFSQGGRYVAGLYRGLLNRDAEYGGWLFQRNAVVTGGIAQLTLVDSFLGSEEYRLKFGTPSNTEYAALLYRYILLREGTPAEIAFQAGALATISRAQLASNFLNSAEFRDGMGPRLTAFLLYAVLLSRDGSPAELASLEAQLKAGVPLLTVVDALLATPEFAKVLE